MILYRRPAADSLYIDWQTAKAPSKPFLLCRKISMEVNMISALDDISSYKNKILASLMNSADIRRLLTKLPDCTAEEAAALIHKQIFPYLVPLPVITGCCPSKDQTNNVPAAVPDTALAEERAIGAEPVFICFEVEVTRTENLRLKEMKISAWVYCPKELMKVSGRADAETLPDILTALVDGCLNSSVDLGLGRLKLSSATCFSPMEHYYGRQLVYHVMDFI